MVFPPGDFATGKILAAAEPFIRAAVLERYGKSVEKLNVCPGEAECDRFQSAKGRGHAEKERNACRPCELFDTKRERARLSRKGLEELVEFSEYAKRRRDSGYPMPLSQISNLMLEVMMRLDDYSEAQEIALRHDTKQALIVGLGLQVK